MKEGNDISAPIMGVSRFRVGRDGNGITTLVAFQGCPLRCKYCINPDCWKPEDNFKHYTPRELYDELKKDDLYFRSTEGGVTFGGGEPALRADFIAEFRKICGPDWKIRIETSLNCQPTYIEVLAPVIDEWIIDTKAAHPPVYLRYTGGRHAFLYFNLRLLTEQLNVSQEKLTLKVPIIPDFVGEAECREASNSYRQSFPNAKVEVVRYLNAQQLREHREKERTLQGKELCNLLTAVRHDIAERYDIDLEKRECTHQGDCPGTCPLCEQEIERLTNEMRSKKIDRPEVSENLRDSINTFDGNNESDDSTVPLSPGGIIIPPEKEVHILHGDLIAPVDFPPLEGQIAEGPPYHEYKKVKFKECALAGVSFHLKYDDELWHELEEGVELALVRHKDNKHDPNAVAVALADDYDGDPDDFDFDFIIGYIPRTDNAELAALLDAGYGDKLSAKITKFSNHGNINNRIRITIYLESSEPVFVRPNFLRATTLDLIEFRDMVEELNRKGTCYMRFGGFYEEPKIKPIAGEKVVAFYQDANRDYIMYMLRVFATGDKCVEYLDDPEDMHMIDDCSPYILTNVCGPIFVKPEDAVYDEIAHLCSDELNPMEYLNEVLSFRLNKIFEKVLLLPLNRNNIDMDPSIDDPKDAE